MKNSYKLLSVLALLGSVAVSASDVVAVGTAVALSSGEAFVAAPEAAVDVASGVVKAAQEAATDIASAVADLIPAAPAPESIVDLAQAAGTVVPVETLAKVVDPAAVVQEVVATQVATAAPAVAQAGLLAKLTGKVSQATATSVDAVKAAFATVSNRSTAFYKDHTRAVQIAAAVAVASVVTYVIYKKYFSKSEVDQAPELVSATRTYSEDDEEDCDLEEVTAEELAEVLAVELTPAEQAEVDEIVDATLKTLAALDAQEEAQA